jgi:hypothetical protein
MVVTKVCLGVWGCILGIRTPAMAAKAFQPTCRGVAVHPGPEGVSQGRPLGAVVDGAVDRPGHRWWSRDEDDLAAFAAHSQDPVAVLRAQVADAGPAGFEDPQFEQAEEGDQGEVVRVGRQPRGGDQGLELQMTEAEGRRLGRHRGPADVVSGRARQNLVDDADPVEADDDRQPAGDRRGLVAARVLQPAHVPLGVHPDRCRRHEVLVGGPAQKDRQVRLGVQPGLATVATKVRRHCRAQHQLSGVCDADVGDRKGSHYLTVRHRSG